MPEVRRYKDSAHGRRAVVMYRYITTNSIQYRKTDLSRMNYYINRVIVLI